MKTAYWAAFVILVTSVGITPVLAATTATVTATVTVQNVSVTVSSGTVTWGTLAVNTASSTHPAYTQVVTNAGNVAEDFTIKGQNTTSWTLASSNGSNQYEEAFCTTSCTSAPTGFTALTTTNQTLATNVTTSGTKNLDLYLDTPTATTDYTQQDVSVTITAAAH
jgi:ribosomal protein L31